MLRLLTLTTALLLTFYLSVPGNGNPRTDVDVGYTVLGDDSAYTTHKQDEKKFLLHNDVLSDVSRSIYFFFNTDVSEVVSKTYTLNIRDPPSAITPA